MLHKKRKNSQNSAERKHKCWRGFYNTASQLSLCQLCKPFSKSAQPLLMNWTFQTNKAWHSLLLEQGQETATGADRQQSHRFFLFNLPIHVCSARALQAHAMCDISPSKRQMHLLNWISRQATTRPFCKISVCLRSGYNELHLFQIKAWPVAWLVADVIPWM